MMIFINLFLFFLIGNSIAYDFNEIIRTMKNPGTTSLSLSYKGLRNGEDFLSIVKTLNETELTTLDFQWNDLRDDGIDVLARYIKHSKITSVDLGCNHISGRGVSVLASVLNQTKIERLFLPRNQLGYEGIMPIVDVLRHTLITELDLRRNNIRDEGAIGLAKGLIGSRITRIHLGHNGIGDEGAEGIARSLNRTMITELHLGWNNISDQGARAIVEVLNDTAITYLDIQGNQISSETEESFINVLNGTQVRDLVTSTDMSGDERRNATYVLYSSLEANRDRMKRLYEQFEDFVVRENGSLEFNAVKAYYNKTDYTDFAGMIADKKRIYGVIFSTEGRVKYPREQIVDFFENIQERLSNSFPKSQMISEQFERFIRPNENGSLEFEVEYSYTNESEYKRLAGIVGENKPVDIQRITNYTKFQVEDFVGNVETRLSECFRARDLRLSQQFNDFVVDRNGSLGFNVDNAFVNVFEYIKFVEFIGSRNQFLLQGLHSNFTREEIEDFVGNVEERLSKCFQDADYIYQQFENFVVDRNGVLEFKVDTAYTNRSEYIEFERIVEEKKQIYINRFVSEGRLNYNRNQIQDFVGNIETRLSECLRKTNLVYQGFISFLFDKNDGPSSSDVAAVIVSRKQNYLNYLISKMDGSYSKDQVEDFMNNVRI